MDKKIKVIITGGTGFVGEGVLMECFVNPAVEQILLVGRKQFTGIKHSKLKELIVTDFFKIDSISDQLGGYDACFYCAGISSRGVTEFDYNHITFDTTIEFARKLSEINPSMVFCNISGNLTDSSEKGKLMWARIKGKTENALMRLPFRKVYNFRPGFMKPTEGQLNVKTYYKIIGSLYPFMRRVFPNQVSTMEQVAKALINSVIKGFNKSILEIKDIKLLAQ